MNNKVNLVIGIVVVLLGIIILMWGSYYDGKSIIENAKSFAQALGCSVILAGIFGVVLEWKSTRDYFGKRLSEIVLEDDYLKRLSKDRLRNLFLSIQRHIFDTDDVKKEGGFLDYFNRHLHGYIVQPYRENVSAEMTFSKRDDGDLDVKDKISYRCREMNGLIQDFVQVKPEENEFLSWDYTSVTLGSGDDKVVEEFDSEKLNEILKSDAPLKVTVPEKLKVDNLKVEIEQHYSIKRTKLQSWQMSHPTRGFKVSISYPIDMKIDTLPLLEVRDEATITKQPGYYGITYNEWMLPQSGITWTFGE
tara:strand:+ start:2435 stop:3349 length:915 start_codon:yes stop_codon:yes gene_type:complete